MLIYQKLLMNFLLREFLLLIQLKKRKHLILKHKNKANILKSFSENDILNSYKSTNNIDKEDNINKKFGFYSSLTLNIGRNINKYTKCKKNFHLILKKGIKT